MILVLVKLEVDFGVDLMINTKNPTSSSSNSGNIV